MYLEIKWQVVETIVTDQAENLLASAQGVRLKSGQEAWALSCRQQESMDGFSVRKGCFQLDFPEADGERRVCVHVIC